MSETVFDYSNLSGRRSGPVLTLASMLLPGVRSVQHRVEPYAYARERHNRAAVAAGSVYGGRIADILERQLPAMESLGDEPDLVTVIIGSEDLISKKLRH